MFTSRDHYWMQQAIELAKVAALAQEVPVGAVLVLDDAVIGEGYNRPIAQCDPTAHAEVIALQEGGRNIANYRLVDATLYVSLEPCLMCVGAMVHARIKRLVYGAYDTKAGAVQSQIAGLNHSFLNHQIIHQGGLMADECGSLLSEFFKLRRLSSKQALKE